MTVLSRRDRLTIPQIPAHSGPAIHSLIEVLNRHGLSPAGRDMVYVYHGCNGDPAVAFDLEICLPVAAGVSLTLEPPMELKSTPPFRCLAVEHVGPMSGIGGSWMKLVQAVRSGGHRPTDESREVYKKWVAFDSPENVTELQQGVE